MAAVAVVPAMLVGWSSARVCGSSSRAAAEAAAPRARQPVIDLLVAVLGVVVAAPRVVLVAAGAMAVRPVCAVDHVTRELSFKTSKCLRRDVFIDTTIWRGWPPCYSAREAGRWRWRDFGFAHARRAQPPRMRPGSWGSEGSFLSARTALGLAGRIGCGCVQRQRG
jgi:hypothetical protein